MSKSTTSVIDTAAIEMAISPRKLAHVVLRTGSNFGAMVRWYCTVLGARVVFNAGRLIFLSYDDEHHRIAIAASEDLAERPRRATGLDHIAFTYEDIGALLNTYARLKRAGILPFCCINHGPTTALMQEQFSINPVGVEFDPEEMLARLRSGANPDELVRPTRNPRPPARDLIAKLIGS
jgi:catechol-2,3-dioxygenase